jgi:outer membrane protein insertion porin family
MRVPFDETTLGYLFVDAAGITRREASDLTKIGFGFGIKLQTVIGTLRLDYGVGETGDGMFYFGMGSVF